MCTLLSRTWCWQVHHGNGTQKVFWEDDRVLFVSVHRRDPGFYPEVGACNKCSGHVLQERLYSL